MTLIDKLTSWLYRRKPKPIEDYVPPDGFVPLGGQCPYSGYYINTDGTVFNRKENTFRKKYRYIRLYGIYHYVPRLVIETFNKTVVENIHSIDFRDNDRDNFSTLNLFLSDKSYNDYFIHNDYTHEVTLNAPGSAKDDEYIIYVRDLLDHNWTPHYRSWLKTHTQTKRYIILELVVDIQNKTLQFRPGRRGVPLAQQVVDKLIYKIICDNSIGDFWIVPPKKKSNFRDLVRMDIHFKLIRD